MGTAGHGTRRRPGPGPGTGLFGLGQGLGQQGAIGAAVQGGAKALDFITEFFGSDEDARDHGTSFSGCCETGRAKGGTATNRQLEGPSRPAPRLLLP